MKRYLTFLWECLRISFVGDWRYYAWMTVLTVVALAGLNAYARQLVHGLATTGMTDQVSWGLFIANFTFLVGLAAAAAMLVIPVYVYRNMHLHDVVIFGELLAVSVIVMCLPSTGMEKPQERISLRRIRLPITATRTVTVMAMQHNSSRVAPP